MGDARASSLTCTKTTGSLSLSQSFASLTEMSLGASIAGIPSLDGPPERISRYGTECLLKSVENSSLRDGGIASSGRKVAFAGGLISDWGGTVLAAGAGVAGVTALVVGTGAAG